MNFTNTDIKDNYPNCVSLKNIKKITSTRSGRNRKDASANNMEDIDPNILFEKLQLFYKKDFRSSEDLVDCKNSLDELLKIESITKREYNTIYRNLYLSKK